MSTTSIHMSSIIDTKAQLGKNVKIGPFCIIGPNVVIGDNVELKSHIIIEGHTTIGENSIIYSFASIGTFPQDLKYAGEASRVIIGKKNTIREYVTIQPGTASGGMVTEIGDNNLLMLGTHVAHDCKVGNNCIFANNATLAGHVTVGDGAVIGGLAAIRQFVRIGQGAMIGGLCGVAQDVLPYATIANEKPKMESINIIGMKRKGFSLEEIQAVSKVIEALFENEEGAMKERVAELRNKYSSTVSANLILDFVESQESKLGYCRA